MATEFRFPDVGEGISEGELVKWLVQEGDNIKADQPLAEIETDKAVVEIPSPIGGMVLKLHAKEGQAIHVGEVLVTIGSPGEKVSANQPSIQAQRPETTSAARPGATQANVPGHALATPAVRKAAREMKVDLSTMRGSGPGGRIEFGDLTSAALGKYEQRDGELAARQQAQGTMPAKALAKEEKQKEERETRVSFEQYGRVLRLPLKGARKIIAERMAKAASTIPHVCHMDEADVTELWEVRSKEKEVAENQGFKLTFLPFVIKACVKALRDHPYLNASIDESTNDIVIKQYYNIGFAVDTGESLIVPVLKKADEMSVLDIAKHIQSLSDAARDRTIDLREMQGGSFSITNLGSIGGTWFTPIINYPEAAILGMGRIEDKAVVRDGKITVRKILPLVLAFDHRILDGAKAARFMNDVIKHLEDPSFFLVDAV